ncbi:MAG: glycosyltransferase [Pyrinomonadaceae bacterium]
MLVAEFNNQKTNKDNSQTETSQILRGRDILCFSHDWTGDPLSKTHIARVLSKDNRILWINSIGYRTPTASTKDVKRALNKMKAFTEPIREVEPNIFVLNPLAIPIYNNESVKAVNTKWLQMQVKKGMRKLGFKNPFNLVFHPPSGVAAGKLGEKEIVYYCVDEYSAFTGVSAEAMLNYEKSLIDKSDFVIVSAERLYETKSKLHSKTFLIRHGVDFSHFQKALNANTKIPDEIANLPRPIIGFHGLLADWVDFELIKKTAEYFKSGSVVLIGKIAVDAEQKVKILNDVKNIHFLGRKLYSDLPNYCKGFDVALNPFAISELTLAANPLKVREYLAAGLPVISTDIPEVAILEHCRIGQNHEDFIRQIEEALKNPRPQKAISDSVQNESWEARVDELREIIKTHI